ncbi:glycoside hydrolase family 43 protein, partial [Atractiella rhizophila]
MYYLMPTMPDGSVSVFVSETLDRFDSPPIRLFMPPNPPVWAPELHIIDGEFYVYCTLPDGPDDADHRMHVLKGTDANDPTKPFEDLGVVGTPDENYAIDGTVLINYLNHEGVLANYFIWSGKESRDTGTVQYLYIAQLSTPSTLIGERTMIHSPYWPDGSRKDWQWSPNDYGVNEGPEILVNGDKTFLIYSACGSWDPCYSLGLMSLNSTGLNPLDPNAWYAKDDGPV